MKRVVITYTVKPNKVEENEQLVRAVYAELNQLNHPGLHYMTVKLDDGVTFQHVAMFDSEADQQVLSNTAAFKAFQENIRERCDVPPNPRDVTLIGQVNFVTG